MKSFDKLRSLLSSKPISREEKDKVEKEMEQKYGGKTNAEVGLARIQVLMSVSLIKLRKGLLSDEEFADLFNLSLEEFRSQQNLYFMLSIREKFRKDTHLTADQSLSLLAIEQSMKAADDTRAVCFAAHRLLNIALPPGLREEDDPTKDQHK